jgi:hypothetical protein
MRELTLDVGPQVHARIDAHALDFEGAQSTFERRDLCSALGARFHVPTNGFERIRLEVFTDEKRRVRSGFSAIHDGLHCRNSPGRGDGSADAAPELWAAPLARARSRRSHSSWNNLRPRCKRQRTVT